MRARRARGAHQRGEGVALDAVVVVEEEEELARRRTRRDVAPRAEVARGRLSEQQPAAAARHTLPELSPLLDLIGHGTWGHSLDAWGCSL